MVSHVVHLVLPLPAQMLLHVDLSSNALHSQWIKRTRTQPGTRGNTAATFRTCICRCFIEVRSTCRINSLLFSRHDLIQTTQSGCPLRVSRLAFAASLLRHLLDGQRVRHHVQMVHIIVLGVVSAGRLIPVV